MVLASPPRLPRPPVDPDDVNAEVEKYSTDLFQILYEGRYPLRYLLLKFDTLRAIEQLRLQPNDTCIPQIFKMPYLRK